MSVATSTTTTKRLFICHAPSEIEAASEVVDALEHALDFPVRAIWASNLPGYALADDDGTELRIALSETNVALVLVSASSARDPQFHFELGATWGMGIRTVLLRLGAAAEWEHVPASIRSVRSVRANDSREWSGLIGDLALWLGLTARRPSFPEPAQHAQQVAAKPAAHARPQASAEGSFEDDAETRETYPRTQLEPLEHQEITDLSAVLAATATLPSTNGLARSTRAATTTATTSALPEPEPQFGSEATLTDDTPAEDYFDDDLLSPDLSSGSEDEDNAPTHETQTETDARFTSSVFARLPTCEIALEAGRAVSDCLFNRDEISDFAQELTPSLGRLLTGLGEKWDELRGSQDLDGWIAHTDQLLQWLPAESRRLENWYRLGFELAILHNLAGQLALDEGEPAAEQRWRGALERFLMRAERAEIGYENLGSVLGLLENLAGPKQERDLANIGRSLEALRRHAAGADRIHTAA